MAHSQSIRIEEELKDKLKTSAKDNERSLTQEIVYRLKQSVRQEEVRQT